MNLLVGISQKRKKGANTCDSGFSKATWDDVKLMLFVCSQLKNDLGTCHLKIIDFDSLHGTD